MRRVPPCSIRGAASEGWASCGLTPAMIGRGAAAIRLPSSIAMRLAPRSEHVQNHLAGFSGILQVDGYAAYKDLCKQPAAPGRRPSCWPSVGPMLRRRFYEIAVGGNAPLADNALARSPRSTNRGAIRGQSADGRRRVRQAQSRPRLEQFKSWLGENLPAFPADPRSPRPSAMPSTIGTASPFLGDGRIEMDTNTVERSSGLLP